MAGTTIFSLRVLSCPSCSATLPVHGDEGLVVCEYCDARVQVSRTKGTTTVSPAETMKPVYTAAPHASTFAWVLAGMVVSLGVSGVMVAVLTGASESEGPDASVPPAIIEAALPQTEPLAESPTPLELPTPSASPVPEPTPLDVESGESEPVEAGTGAASVDPPTKKKSTTPSPALPAPTGPVLSSGDARGALEPAILDCMRAQGVHDILAYMGNSTVGPVKVLGDSRSRVDGVQAKIKGTTLGKCMDKAGAAVRVRAFKSDYVRFALVNDAVPDPLAALPAKADRDEVDRIIASADPEVLQCAVKHGEEGGKEVFYFVIDGPSGKPSSVRASYLSKGFKKCAEAIYGKLSFPKVREWQIKVTKHLKM